MKANDFDLIKKRIIELDQLQDRARQLGYEPEDGVLFTPRELDELFESRKLIGEVKKNHA